MSTGAYALHPLHGPQNIETKVRRAATYAGDALSMSVNLNLAGMPDRAKVWELETAAWEARKDKLIQGAPFGRTSLQACAAEAISASLQAGLICETSNTTR